MSGEIGEGTICLGKRGWGVETEVFALEMGQTWQPFGVLGYGLEQVGPLLLSLL